MKFKEHLSEEILELLLKDELPEKMRSAAGLHLSYCPICREQKDDLALQLAAHRMWEAYERSGSPGDPHVEDNAFRHFWLGELRDKELIKQLSRHCVVCRDCRRRREFARAEIENERTKAREWAFRALVLAAARAVQKRRYVIAGVGTTIILAIVTIQVLLNQQTVNQTPPNDAKSDVAGVVPTDPAPNDNSSRVTPIQEPPINSSPKMRVSPSRHATRQKEASPDLIAQAQRIDLAQVPDGTDSRSPGDVEDGVKTYFKIVASRSGPTHLRIGLPVNSKRGVYYVSILEPAFLAEIVPAKGKSPDGVILSVSIPIQDLKMGKYVLRITRRNPKASENEYIGDYGVLVARPASRSDRPDRDTSNSEK